MESTLRKDGSWTFFRVEYFVGNPFPDSWSTASDRMIAGIPEEERFTAAAGRAYLGESKQPFSDFSASGECWQATGISGTLKETRAIKLAELLSKYNPGTRFRVVRHTCLQVRTELASFHRCE